MTKNGQYKVDIERRITSLEVTLTEIVENHLPHIEAKVDKLTWLLITNLTAIIFLLLQKYL